MTKNRIIRCFPVPLVFGIFISSFFLIFYAFVVVSTLFDGLDGLCESFRSYADRLYKLNKHYFVRTFFEIYSYLRHSPVINKFMKIRFLC